MSTGLVSAYLSAVLSKEGGGGGGGGGEKEVHAGVGGRLKRKCMLECKSCLQG